MAAVALTAAWAKVTVGRIVFATIERWVPSRTSYCVLPFLLAGTFVFIGFLPDRNVGLGVLAFGLAGLGCSALLPLTIGFGQEELVSMLAAASGVIAFSQVGYGTAAFGVGPLLDHGTALPTVYQVGAIVAAAMGLLSPAVTRRQRDAVPSR